MKIFIKKFFSNYRKLNHKNNTMSFLQYLVSFLLFSFVLVQCTAKVVQSPIKVEDRTEFGETLAASTPQTNNPSLNAANEYVTNPFK